MQPVIELSGLGVRFGSRDILKDLRVSLSGRTIRLPGAEWPAPKSTLIQSLLGFCPLTSGTALASSATTSGADQKQIRTVVGYMPENDCFYPPI